MIARRKKKKKKKKGKQNHTMLLCVSLIWELPQELPQEQISRIYRTLLYREEPKSNLG